VNLTKVFLVWLPNFTLNHLLLFWWLQLLQVYSYISFSTFVASLYINSWILISVHWYRHIYHCAPFLFFVFKYYIWPICCNISVCTPWFYMTVTSSCSHSGLCVCMCVYQVSVNLMCKNFIVSHYILILCQNKASWGKVVNRFFHVVQISSIYCQFLPSKFYFYNSFTGSLALSHHYHTFCFSLDVFKFQSMIWLFIIHQFFISVTWELSRHPLSLPPFFCLLFYTIL
jgi:hypothetical protein